MIKFLLGHPSLTSSPCNTEASEAAKGPLYIKLCCCLLLVLYVAYLIDITVNVYQFLVSADVPQAGCTTTPLLIPFPVLTVLLMGPMLAG